MGRDTTEVGGRLLDGRVYDEMPEAWTSHLKRLEGADPSSVV
jgi:hypothetical protein